MFFQFVTLSFVGSWSSRWRMSMLSKAEGEQQGEGAELLEPRPDLRPIRDCSKEWSLRGLYLEYSN